MATCARSLLPASATTGCLDTALSAGFLDTCPARRTTRRSASARRDRTWPYKLVAVGSPTFEKKCTHSADCTIDWLPRLCARSLLPASATTGCLDTCTAPGAAPRAALRVRFPHAFCISPRRGLLRAMLWPERMLAMQKSCGDCTLRAEPGATPSAESVSYTHLTLPTTPYV